MISEAFWLRELSGIQAPLNDIIHASEVIIREDSNPIHKYRDFIKTVHESACFIIDLVVEELERYTESKGSQQDFWRVWDDLSTPLNAILGYSEMMIKELLGPIDGRYRAYAEKIYASGILVMHVSWAMLDLMRFQAGMMEPCEERVDVDKAVQEALREVMPEAMQRQVTMTWLPSAAKLPDLFCDRSCLRRMLLNILVTAAKFNQPGRMVEVGTDLSDGLAIVIRDTGWGILTDSLMLIWTKSLIQRHGGQVSVGSTPNDGVIVRLSFPRKRIIQ
jgi:signal transduction histidine kinase